MNLGIEEQINTDKFLPFCDYIYTPREDYLYVQQEKQKYPHLQLFSPDHGLKEDGIIFVGQCCQVEECFKLMKDKGNFIVIQRDNERAFIPDYYKEKKQSVRHVYTIECQVDAPDVTAMPFGTASIGGDSMSLVQVQNEEIEKTGEVFCRLNTNGNTHERRRAVNVQKNNPLVKVEERQLGSIEFYREIKAHKFNLSLRSGGMDTTRTWETLFLGTIPIISDVMELRWFEDMPVAYYQENITKEWLDSIDVSGKSLKRATMSYWRDLILNHKASW